MSVFYIVPESVADPLASQYTHLGVERRASLATGARGSTSRRETGQDSTLKANPVRFFFHAESDVAKRSVTHGVCTVPVRGLDDRRVVQIACGQQHSIALDDGGYAHRSNLRKHVTHSSPNAVLYTSGGTMAIVVWVLGIKKTF